MVNGEMRWAYFVLEKSTRRDSNKLISLLHLPIEVGVIATRFPLYASI